MKALSKTENWKLKSAYSLIKGTKEEAIIVHPLSDHIPLEDEVLLLFIIIILLFFYVLLINSQKICSMGHINTFLVGDCIHPMSPYIGMK